MDFAEFLAPFAADTFRSQFYGRHRWREGEIMAFDDSFEHEAWNRAGADRVVLIFEAHHPDLAVEREAIQHAIEFRGRWLEEQQVPAA